MEETKEFRSIPQENYNNIFWFHGNSLNVIEEKLLFYILKSIKEETIIEKRKVYDLSKRLKDMTEWFGTKENPLAPRRTKEVISTRKGSVGKKVLLTTAAQRENTIKKFQNLESKIIGYEINPLEKTVEHVLEKKGNIFEEFEYQGGELYVRLNKAWADKNLYPELKNGVSFLTTEEMKHYKSKFTFRLERLLKQKIQTGAWKFELHMPIELLREIMLDNHKVEYEDHNEFKNKVLRRAINELNEYSYLSEIKIIGVNHKVYKGGRISFRYTALKKDLDQVAPKAAYREKQISTLIETGSMAIQREKPEKVSYITKSRKPHRNNNSIYEVELMEEDIEF